MVASQCDRALAPSGSRQGGDKGSQEGCDRGGPSAAAQESLEQQLGHPAGSPQVPFQPESLCFFLQATLPIDVTPSYLSCCPCIPVPMHAAQHLSRGKPLRGSRYVYRSCCFAFTLQFSPATLDYAMYALSFQTNFEQDRCFVAAVESSNETVTNITLLWIILSYILTHPPGLGKVIRAAMMDLCMQVAYSMMHCNAAITC